MNSYEAWTHKKTNNTYYKLYDAIDCTNSRDGTSVVVYTRDGNIFVRERSEFEQKFTKSKES